MVPYVGSTMMSGVRLSVRRIVEFEREFSPAHHFVDKQRNSIGIEVVRNLLAGNILSLQPDERDVIVLHKTARACRTISWRWRSRLRRD